MRGGCTCFQNGKQLGSLRAAAAVCGCVAAGKWFLYALLPQWWVLQRLCGFGENKLLTKVQLANELYLRGLLAACRCSKGQWGLTICEEVGGTRLGCLFAENVTF